MKVLVVDGSETDRRSVVDALHDLTNVVVQGAVPDLGRALRVLADDVPDVVVTEALLADGDAVRLIEAARRLERPPAVVVLTAIRSDALCQRCVDAGVDLYLTKPAGIRELKGSIVELARGRGRRSDPPDPFRLLGRLAAGVAHDLNNYLTVLDVSLSMFDRSTVGLEHARAAVEAASRLTGTLLAYARGADPAPAAVDLGELVQDAIWLLRSTIRSSIAIVLEIDDGVPPVLGIAAELEQLVLNLVLNACDAMPGGGELRVAVRAIGDEVRLEVADTGGGLDRATRTMSGPRTPSTKNGRPGAGLGLGIVRAVADRHRARLCIAPRSGGGTLVAVMVPIVASDTPCTADVGSES